MPEGRKRIWVQRENDKGKTTTWTNAQMAMDSMVGVININSSIKIGKKWSITLTPSMVTTFTIEMITDVNSLAAMYGGGLVGFAIAAIMARWAKMPALKLTQDNAEPGQRWVMIRGVGFQPRAKTREMANNVEQFLLERGYRGEMPNLSDDTPWKYPIVPVAIGCGAVLLVVLALFVVLVFAASQ